MKRVTHILILFFLAMEGFCQKPLYGSSSLVTPALSPIDIWTGSHLGLGYEFDFKSKYASYSELSLFFSSKSFKDHQGFIFKEELKLFNERSGRERIYQSIEVTFSLATFDRTDSILVNDNPEYELTYSNDRLFYGFSYKIGSTITFNNSGLFLDFFIGAGIRFNHIKNTLTSEISTDRYFGDWTNPLQYSMKKGFGVLPKLNAGLKIGYRFGRKKLKPHGVF